MNNKNGFHVMSKEQLREVSRKGGRSAHIMKRAHTFSSEEAKLAGRKGGLAFQANRRAKLEQAASEAPTLPPPAG
jgi:uncharacterized protein